jgi:hypothetical protein
MKEKAAVSAGRATSWLGRYMPALLVGGACIAARMALNPLFPQDRGNFLILVPLLLVAAAVGGIGAALGATALGLAVNLLLVGQTMLTDRQNLIGAAIFVVLGVTAGLGGGRLRGAAARASASILLLS